MCSEQIYANTIFLVAMDSLGSLYTHINFHDERLCTTLASWLFLIVKLLIFSLLCLREIGNLTQELEILIRELEDAMNTTPEEGKVAQSFKGRKV